jgi:hypothetical protein
MTLSPEEAATHLQEADAMSKRSATAFGYSRSAPHLILWGVVWLIGYAACDFFPGHGDLIWTVLLIAAWIATLLICGRGDNRKEFNRVGIYRAGGMIVAITAFIYSVYWIFAPITHAQAAVFPSLIIGALYFAMGFWIGWRMIVAGTAIYLLALGGYFLLPQHVSLLMALAGGGTLIASGLWLRKI